MTELDRNCPACCREAGGEGQIAAASHICGRSDDEGMAEKQPDYSHRADHLGKHQWQPGQSGNPNGRPPSAGCITSHMQNRLHEIEPDSGKTYARLVAEAYIDEARSRGSTRGSASKGKEVLERTEGKVKDTIEVEGGSIELVFTPAKKREDAV